VVCSVLGLMLTRFVTKSVSVKYSEETTVEVPLGIDFCDGGQF